MRRKILLKKKKKKKKILYGLKDWNTWKETFDPKKAYSLHKKQYKTNT